MPKSPSLNTGQKNFSKFKYKTDDFRKTSFSKFIKYKPACYQGIVQSEVHLEIPQISDRSHMQYQELACHLVQVGIYNTLKCECQHDTIQTLLKFDWIITLQIQGLRRGWSNTICTIIHHKNFKIKTKLNPWKEKVFWTTFWNWFHVCYRWWYAEKLYTQYLTLQRWWGIDKSSWNL